MRFLDATQVILGSAAATRVYCGAARVYPPLTQAAVTVVAFGTNGAESTNTLVHNLTVPALQDGDVMVVSDSLASTATVTPSAMFADNYKLPVSSRSGLGHHAWVRPMLASEAGAVVNFATSATLKTALQFVVLRGLSASPLDSSTPAPANGPTAQAFSAPAVTPAAGKIALQLIATTTGSSAPPALYTPPTGLTLLASNGTGGSTGRAGGAIGVSLTPNTSVGNGWATDVLATWSAMTLILNQAPAA